MKKSLYFLSLVVLFLTSCSSDSESSDEPLLLLKKIVTVSNDSSRTISFTYNGTKLNTIELDGFVLQHTYSGNKIVNVKRYSGEMLEGETFYEYDNLGRVSSELFVYYVSDFSQKKIYTYNSNNTISYQMLSGDQFTQTPNGYSGLINQGTNGEVLKVEVFNQGVIFNTDVYTYDTKNSPYKNIVGYDKLPINTDKIFNVLTSKNFNVNQEINTNSIFDYTYNSNNFPTERNQSFYNSEGELSSVSSTYFY